MSRPVPKLRGWYKRSFKPSVEECERRIIDAWFNLCNAEATPAPSAERELRERRVYRAVQLQRLHDMAIFRARAMKREAVAQ